MPTHSTSSPLRFFLFCTSLIASVFMAGCGGSNKQQPDPAPSSLNGRTLTIRDAVLPSTTAFIYAGSVSGTYTSPLPAGNGDSGTFTYTKTVGTIDRAVLQMTSISSTVTTYNLTFTSYTGGNYTDNLANSSTFTIN